MLPELPEAKKAILLREAPGPTKAVLNLIKESKKRELKEFEKTSYERAMKSLEPLLEKSGDVEDPTSRTLYYYRAKKEVLYIYSRKLGKNIAIVPQKGWRNVRDGFEVWTTEEVLAAMKRGLPIDKISIVKNGIDGELIP